MVVVAAEVLERDIVASALSFINGVEPPPYVFLCFLQKAMCNK